MIQQLPPVRVAGQDEYPPSAPQLVLLDPRSARDVVDAVALVDFAAGRQPWARTKRLQSVPAAVAATPAVTDRVALGFWHHASLRGAHRDEREILAPSWASIRANYAPATAHQLDRLMDLTAEEVRGRLILLYGQPGTGKTSALRALARLLNLTDGLLGQGRDVLVAITTNEDLTRLHPAVIRPGRCLSQIEFARLAHQQAAAWLGTSAGIGTDGATLAELYALRDGIAPDGTEPGPARRGLYL